MKEINRFILIFLGLLFVAIDLFVIIESSLIIGDIYSDSFITTKTVPRYENDLPYDNKIDYIATLGCSFTYGESIDEKETFAYKLQQQTKRKTYNLGISGRSIQHVLYIIQNYPLFNEKKDNEVPKYVIYTFISDHVRRLYLPKFDFPAKNKNRLYYVEKNKIYPKKAEVTFFDYIEMSPLSMYINYNRFHNSNLDERFDILKLYIEKCNEELKKRRKDAEFVVLVYYPVLDYLPAKPYKFDNWDELEKEGIKVIRLDNENYNFLTEREYLASDNFHPSGKAWDKIVPLVIEELNL